MILRRGNSERGGIFSGLLSLAFLIVFCSIVYFARHPLLRLAGGFWVVDEMPQTSDAIVILGDDNYNGDRAARAAELFKAGWAPRVIASGRYLRPYAGISELEAHDLADHGVPDSSIVRFAHRAENTRDECLALGPFIDSHGWKRILLVTSNYHTRRSRYICNRALPQGTALRVIAAPDSEYDVRAWWESRLGEKIFFHEVVGFVLAKWEMRNDHVQTAP